MAWLNLSDIATMVQGSLKGTDVAVSAVGIDSRTLKPGELFIALKGARFDGHDFIAEVQHTGASAVMVSNFINTSLPQIYVQDTMAALAQLATQWRRRLKTMVLALTGSNGKTTTKEIITHIVKRHCRVTATPGNYNNHIGVPLSLLSVRAEHQVAVIEMGANHLGEIRHLCGMARPDIGLVLNAAPAHIEGFGSLDGVAKGKGELFECLSDDAAAVVNRDDAYYDYWKQLLAERRALSFGLSPSADFHLISQQNGTLHLSLNGTQRSCRLQLLGRHNIANALAAAAASSLVGASADDIAAGISEVVAVGGRLSAYQATSGVRLLDDSYNANPSSLEVALSVLAQQPGEHWLALGSMAELGAASSALHIEAGMRAKQSGVRRLYTVGREAEQAARYFGDGSRSFSSVEALIEHIKTELKPGVSLLVKGSRCARMDKLVSALRTLGDGEV